MAEVFDCGDLTYWEFPLNLIIGLVWIGGMVLLHTYYRTHILVRWWGSMQATFWLVGICLVLLIGEGIWAFRWVHTWIFVGLAGGLLLNLGFVILRHIRPFSWRNVLFLLNHAGLWLALGAALLGAPDRKEVKMIVPLARTEYVAVDGQGRLSPLPFTVTLQNFTVDYYEGERGIPRRFCSEVILQNRKRQLQAAIEVNKPVFFEGYAIYQDNYDREKGLYSVLLLVRDPWLGVVYAGIGMMIAGAVGLMTRGPLKLQRKCSKIC